MGSEKGNGKADRKREQVKGRERRRKGRGKREIERGMEND